MTGSSGFLGKIIKEKLSPYDLLTLGRSKSDIYMDLESEVPLLPKSDIVIHAAGKAHFVPTSAEEKQSFYDVNVLGTKKLLESLEKSGSVPKSFVFISTVAVYGKTTGVLINEESPLQAEDAYGVSKIKAEKIIENWCNQNKVICTILRLPLLAGPTPPGNLGAMINGIRKGYFFTVDGGGAKKSIVLAEDVAEVLIKVSSIGGIYNLTDGRHPTFLSLSEKIASELGKSKPLNLDLWFAKVLAKCGDLLGSYVPINSNKLFKIISSLTFDDSKAREKFGWNPKCVLSEFKVK